MNQAVELEKAFNILNELELEILTKDYEEKDIEVQYGNDVENCIFYSNIKDQIRNKIKDLKEQ